ncbi:MAG: lysine-2,3-aminomutase-like protein [Methylobacteriaceae bacterium]|nr:lysine-2,3-aminomutase-like protein [Methylobacteriaceae bacterium]
MTPDRTIRSAEALAARGLVPPERETALARVAARYAVSLTPAVVALIDPADPADPIARQYVPNPAELETAPGELADPIGDEAHSPVPGIVHRYPDRVLLKPVQVCAVYCRFCFRREAVGPGAEALSPAALARALDYIRATPAIWEVILSGGDPLVLSPRRLARIADALAATGHVKALRVHSRLPVADPERVTAALARALVRPELATWLVLHANHPRELTPAARAACARLVAAGIPLLSQSVLLRDVNDDPATLEALMRAFVEARVKPYYLHHGDPAPGTAHLRTGLAEGQALVGGLRGRVSGLCQPDYVLDIPGGHGKSPVGPAFLDPEGRTVRDWQGRTHPVPPCPSPPLSGSGRPSGTRPGSPRARPA